MASTADSFPVPEYAMTGIRRGGKKTAGAARLPEGVKSVRASLRLELDWLVGSLGLFVLGSRPARGGGDGGQGVGVTQPRIPVLLTVVVRWHQKVGAAPRAFSGELVLTAAALLFRWRSCAGLPEPECTIKEIREGVRSGDTIFFFSLSK